MGSRDRAPGGATAGEWGDQPCLVCIAEGRPRGLGGGRPAGGTGGVPRRAGTHNCCCCPAPSCQAGSAGGSPRGMLARPPRASGNPLPAGSGSRNAPSPRPRLVWPPSAPPEARHTLPGQGQPASWRKLPWALPAARPGGGLRPGYTGGPHWGWAEGREPGDRVPGLPQPAPPSRGLWAPLKPGPLALDLHLLTGPLDPPG